MHSSLLICERLYARQCYMASMRSNRNLRVNLLRYFKKEKIVQLEISAVNCHSSWVFSLSLSLSLSLSILVLVRVWNDWTLLNTAALKIIQMASTLGFFFSYLFIIFLRFPTFPNFSVNGPQDQHPKGQHIFGAGFLNCKIWGSYKILRNNYILSLII